MSTFDENKHPRGQAGNAGQFREKAVTPPTTSLSAGEGVVPEMLTIPRFPIESRFSQFFADAKNYADVDVAWQEALSNGDGSFSDEMIARWAAVERGTQLRENGVLGVPANPLSRTPRYGIFKNAQNDAELLECFSLATEEMHGDGEAPRWLMNSYYGEVVAGLKERRAELIAAGAIDPAFELEVP
jgi:hypothetical protein